MFYARSNFNTCPIKNLFIISNILVFSVFSIQFTTTNIDSRSIHYCSASNKKKILFNTKRKTFEGVLLSIDLSNQTIKYSLRNLYGVGSKPVHAVATTADKITVVSLTAVARSVYLNLCICWQRRYRTQPSALPMRDLREVAYPLPMWGRVSNFIVSVWRRLIRSNNGHLRSSLQWSLECLRIMPPYRAWMQYAIRIQPVFVIFKTTRAKLRNHTQISCAETALL